MKLMVNTCGHRLCESCVAAVFPHPSAPCPECGVVLRKNQFRLQQFDDSRVEIEVDIRKKILKDFNKTQDDFVTLRDYNDYLEEVETIIYNMSNGIDVEEMKSKVEYYRKENQAIILRNRNRQQRQEQVLSTQLAIEREEVEQRNKEALAKELEVARMKKKQTESILDDLIYSDLPANEVLASHRTSGQGKDEKDEDSIASNKGGVTYPSHQEQAGTVVYSTLPIETGEIYHYVPPVIETCGPPIPLLEDMGSLGYLSHIGDLEDVHQGGGFLPSYACQRALQEAYSCLLLFPDDLS